MENIDLHIHSNLSDGTLSPEETIKLAKENKCYKLCISDHELVGDYSSLAKLYNVKVLTGAEFNTSVKNLHILGYGMTDVNGVNNYMNDIKRENEKISLEVIDKLQKDSFDISENKVREYIKNLNINCDMMDKRKIVKYLIYKNYSSSVLETYDKLIGPGQKYYVPNKKMTPNEIMDLITNCHGISVLAHPNTLKISANQVAELVKDMRKNGLKGIEIINGKMLIKDAMQYNVIASEYGFIKTVGSDFHDPQDDIIGISVGNEIYQNIEEEIYKIR